MVLEDIALTLTPGLGLRGVVKLLEVFGSAEKIFGASREELIHFARLRADLADAVVRRVAFAHARYEVEYCRRHSIIPIASTDEAYPPLLRQIVDYPHVIYVMGDPSVLLRPSVSVIGTRRITPYGDRMSYNVVRDLGSRIPEVSIVSGLAFGVDSAAHRAALHCGVRTVAVVANVLPAVTPAQHTSLAADIIEHGGAIVSECHSGTKQRGHLYLLRNRIVAALSGATVVVESPLSGGSISTASIAASYDRLVMAVPGRLTDQSSAGCNLLIRNNQAQVYLSADQLIGEMMWDSTPRRSEVVESSEASNLTAEQQRVLDCFVSDDPISLEELCDGTGLDVSSLSVVLMELELQGVIGMLHGNRYMRLLS